MAFDWLHRAMRAVGVRRRTHQDEKPGNERLSDGAPWHVPAARLNWLAEAKRTKPEHDSCTSTFLGLMACGGLFASTFLIGVYGLTLTNGAVASLSFGWLVFMVRQGAAWRRRFTVRDVGRRWHISTEHEPRTPLLTYTTLRSNLDDKDELHINFGLTQRFSIGPSAPLLFEPSFDMHLGISGPPLVRALMGEALGQKLVFWHTQLDLTVKKGQISIPLDSSVEDFDWVVEIVSFFGAFADRFAHPEHGLIERIQTDPPFHAVLAWQVLKDMYPGDARRLLDTLNTHQPERAAMLQNESAPFDRSVKPHLRVALFCAMLSARPRETKDIDLLDKLFAQTPQDLNDAMVLLEMLDAAATTRSRSRQAKPLFEAVSQRLIEDGDMHTLEWLAERGKARGLRQSSDQLAGQIKTRLHTEKAGQLALEYSARTGALSDARAGEVSFVDPSTDSDQEG